MREIMECEMRIRKTVSKKKQRLMEQSRGTEQIMRYQKQNIQIFEPKNMSTNYFPKALIQQMLFYMKAEEYRRLEEEIESMKLAIACRHKKHRRCDKEIQKNIECPYCEKIYATNVALKLHLKLKHKSLITNGDSISNNPESYEIPPEES